MRKSFRRLWNALLELRLTCLLIALFVAIGALIFARGTTIVPVFGAVYALVTVGVFAAAPRSSVRYVTLLVGGASFLCAIGLQANPMNQLLQTVQTMTGGALYLCLFVAVTRRLLRHRTVTLETVSGAMALYLLIGLIFGKVFGLIEAFAPGSFHANVGGRTQAIAPPYGELIYFSFITLTTCGLGDVAPVTPLARTLTVWELIGGFFYTIGVLSRVVGVHIASALTQAAGDTKPEG